MLKFESFNNFLLSFINKNLNKKFFIKYIFYCLLIVLFVDLAAICIFSLKPITFISCVLLSLLLIAISVSAFSLLDRKIIAVIQRRRGPNVVGLWGSLQGIMDAIKLIFKEIIYPSEAGIQLFLFAPIMTLSISLLGWCVIGLHPILCFSNLSFDLLLIIIISSLNVYSIILAG